MNRPVDATNLETMDEIQCLFQARGRAWYGGEAVSQLEHALQSAMFAERESAPPELVVAALLHDVGHLLHDLPEDAADQGVDDQHETVALDWLSRRFGPAVAEPVAMHVAAKRYLCAVDADYLARLSPASRQSLRVQGGPMTREEISSFEERPFFADALRLRRWDDAAKVAGLATPTLDHFAPWIQRSMLVVKP